jgi:AcrR family transcriptional regulator
VTIQGVARDAGVSGQTVLNHFGDKESLFAQASNRLTEQVWSRRGGIAPGDVDAAIDALAHDYEVMGDATIRGLALEERVDAIKPLIARGRAAHRQWVEQTFGRPDIVRELVVATDVYTWKLLRRDQGLSQERTRDAIRRIVRALLALDPHSEES